ncbi:ATP-binding protein [candidate division KSB1 bacterium]|nr:ATP-binding protein [candidate division KSB1 bacterium]
MVEREFEDELEKEQDLPTDPRIQIQMTYGTIRNLVDAIVELVTNSDDSYKRLEEKGIKVKGEIKIYIRRLKYGKCERLEVLDFAEGMDKEDLKKALKFAAETSGFEKGKSVRGLFGRGLKEAIMALGIGEIYTIKDDKLSKAILWQGTKGGRYRPPKGSHIPSKEEREEIGIIEGNGTLVRISVTNEKMSCPDYKTLVPRITNHYALRDINSSPKRKVILNFETPEKRGLMYTTPISYEAPKGKVVFDESIKLSIRGDTIEIKIYKSDEKLESPHNNPFAKAGLLIKTANAILDNELFKYTYEEAGCFFFGEVIWEGLAERLRKGQSLLDLNRVGVEWKQEVCQVLRDEIERILEPFIEKKRKQLEVKPAAPPPEKTRKMLNKLCSLLNRFAKEVLSELPPDIEPGEKIEELTIKPSYANIEIDKERPFSVYAPLDILDLSSAHYEVKVESDNLHIQILDPDIELQPDHKYPDRYYRGKFRVIGRIDKEEATITCKLGEHTATAIVRVAPLGKIGKRKKLTGPRGGFFRKIEADSNKDPSHRVRYDKGVIRVFIKFPVVAKYLDESLSPETPEAKAVLAELVGEAFCRFVAREGIDRGKYIVLTSEIDAFATAINELQKNFLHLIHEAILKYKL